MQSVIQFKQAIRPLHWVVKISDLKQSIKLLETLGCRILRHEEFEEGCAASCNGPYAGFWSKTMIGFDNEDNSFVFELTYNYGVFEYKRGNDLKSINLHKFNKNGEDIEAKLNKEFPDVQKNNDGIYEFINSDFVFKFVDSKASNDQLISGLTFNCLDQEKTEAFYQKISFQKTERGFVLPGFDYFTLEFNQVQSIDRAEAYGRIALSCADEDVQKAFEESGATVINSPITLKTEGKADVVVTILGDPNGQEICFVNDSGFRDLSKETGEKVDWERYDKLSSKINPKIIKMQEYRQKLSGQ